MRSKKSLLRMIVQPIVIAIALALLVRATLFRIYAVPSASMEPTLQIGDHIVVTPYRRPWPAKGPEHGDVVVFRSPSTPDELMVKRVIGTPGDLIEARSGRVLIGGHALAEPYLRAAAESGAISSQIVPAGCYFVMGDNRGDSWDSRNWGVLPADLVVGRVRMVLWSSGDGSSEPRAQATTVSRESPAPSRIGLGRMFRRVE